MPVQQGDLVCIIFGCTVPVILRREPPKEPEDVKNEKWQDRFESFRSVLSTCEEACFRKLRYKRKLESLVDVEREAWKYEVREEMKAVNRQIKIWQEREKGLNNQKEAEEKEKTMRKNEAEERKKKRASTFPTLSPQQKDVTDTAIDAIIAEETASAPTGGDGETEADPDENAIYQGSG
ncbi:hypothetical protein PG987_014735 [Apiospora arundinis]